MNDTTQAGLRARIEALDRHGTYGQFLDAGEVLALLDTPPAPQETAPAAEPVAFQARVAPWMDACFGAEIASDRLERGDRLLEEVLELLQSGEYPQERVAALIGYVWSRPKGEPAQEVGGVMVTLAAYCLAHGIGMHDAGEVELARVWTKVEKIREKQAAKPTGSALPMAWPASPPPSAAPTDNTALMEAVDVDLIEQAIRDRTADGASPREVAQYVADCIRAALASQPAAPVADTDVAATEDWKSGRDAAAKLLEDEAQRIEDRLAGSGYGAVSTSAVRQEILTLRGQGKRIRALTDPANNRSAGEDGA